MKVLHADNHVLAVAKPAGVPTVGDSSGDESLYDRAREWVRVTYEKPGNVFLGVVHRLDRPVSGVCLFARTGKAASRLSEAFRDRSTEKVYLAVTLGRPQLESGTVEQWLVKDRERNVVAAVDGPREDARHAVTHWEIVETGPGPDAPTLLRLRPETGRAHQLRVAARTLGCPILGDLKYGATEPLEDRSIALHARAVGIPHPTRDEGLEISCALPATPWWSGWSALEADP